MVGPDIRSGRRVHQLKIYSQSAVTALNATDHRVLHTQVCHEVCHVHLTIAIEVRCLLRDHPQFAEAAEVPDQVMGEGPGERRIVWLPGAVGGKGQNHQCLAPLQLRSEEHTSELQSRRDLVCRLLLEKKKKKAI